MPDDDSVLSIDDVVSKDGYIILKPKTNVLDDNTIIKKFGEELIKYLDENSTLPYCINLGEITKFSSYALDRLVNFQSQHKAKMQVSPSLIVSKQVYLFLDVTGMKAHFDVYMSSIDFVKGRKMK